jgi:hypothetical protein
MISSERRRLTTSTLILSAFIIWFASTALPICTLVSVHESTTKSVEEKEEKILHYQSSRQKELSRRQAIKIKTAFLSVQNKDDRSVAQYTTQLKPQYFWFDYPSPLRGPPVSA